jgi:serine protease
MNSPFFIRKPVHLLGRTAAASLAFAAFAPAAMAAQTVPGEVVVGYDHGVSAAAQDQIAATAGTTPGEQVAPTSQVVHLRQGESTSAAIARLKQSGSVAWAVPNRVAHAAGASSWMPNDVGRIGRAAGGWLTSQWNFSSSVGVSAGAAWANLNATRHPGGSGVKIAVIDSGVAYTNWGKFKRSPDFTTTKFSDPYDFIAHNRFPLDRNGHGTHIAGTIAESTNNHIYMTGLAWGATIMPLRVLDSLGNGDSASIAQAIRYAADHKAQVINLSIEFDTHTTARDIPDVISAIDYATRKGALVVAAAGNDAQDGVAYPARTANALAVGATTEHGCLSDFSDFGPGLDIVAPGGGSDAAIADDPNCRPDANPGRDIVQLSLRRDSHGAAVIPYVFELDAEDGTSMATPHVSAAAALVIASGTAGARPTPAQLRARLLSTATPRSQTRYYGGGLLNAGRATASNG